MVDMSGPTAATTHVVDVTDADFEQVVIQGSMQRPVVVDMWASWCAPCRTLGPDPREGGARARRRVPARQARRRRERRRQRAAAGGAEPGHPDGRGVQRRAAGQHVHRGLPRAGGQPVHRRDPAQRGGDRGRRGPRRRGSPATSSRPKRATAMRWRRTPANRDAAIGLARILVARGDIDEARALAEPLLPDADAERIMATVRVHDWGSAPGEGAIGAARARRRGRPVAGGARRPARRLRRRPRHGTRIDGRHLLDPRRRRARGRVPPEARRPPLLSRVEGASTMTDVNDRIREFWDRDSATYDHSASHAASDPLEAAAWRAALRRALPDPPASVLDVGAGTGSLSLLAAELRYEVTALDLSEGMLSKAREKAAARGARARVRGGVGDVAARGPVRRGHGTPRALDDARPGRGAARVAPGDARRAAAWCSSRASGARGLPPTAREHAVADVLRVGAGHRRPPSRARTPTRCSRRCRWHACRRRRRWCRPSTTPATRGCASSGCATWSGPRACTSRGRSDGSSTVPRYALIADNA